jgi:membrane protein implicated in regulation of membrane protease activity
MWIWFGLAALALIGEVLTGTFYLLLVALGLATSGLAAWARLNFQMQLLICGGVALAGLFVLRAAGVLKKREIDASRNVDVNLDIGQTVQVQSWADTGLAQVWYRGTYWQAELAAGQLPKPGRYVITEVRGSRLVLMSQPSDNSPPLSA